MIYIRYLGRRRAKVIEDEDENEDENEID